MTDIYIKYLKYYTMGEKARKYTKLYLSEVGMIEYTSTGSSCNRMCFFAFSTKNKRITKDLPLEKLKKELVCSDEMKMIFISLPNSERYAVYKILNEISDEKGICTPIIETHQGIIYFPKLKYSDIGLLKCLCEENENINHYKILMTCGN